MPDTASLSVLRTQIDVLEAGTLDLQALAHTSDRGKLVARVADAELGTLRFTFANRAAKQILGGNPRLDQAIIPPELLPEHRAGVARYLAGVDQAEGYLRAWRVREMLRVDDPSKRVRVWLRIAAWPKAENGESVDLEQTRLVASFYPILHRSVPGSLRRGLKV